MVLALGELAIQCETQTYKQLNSIRDRTHLVQREGQGGIEGAKKEAATTDRVLGKACWKREHLNMA